MRLGYNQHFRLVSSNSMLKRLGCILFGVSFKNKYVLFREINVYVTLDQDYSMCNSMIVSEMSDERIFA